jgi:adenylate kinase family enzyme
MEMKKFDAEVKSVNNVLDSQRKKLKSDIESLHELKNKRHNLDDLYQKYITDYELSKDGKQINEKSLGRKISNYLKHTGLTPDELAHRFVEKDLPINLNNLEYNFINIPNAEKKFVDLKIIDEDESNLLCKILLTFSDENIREDLFSHFLKGLVDDAEKNLKKNKISQSKKKYNLFPKKKKLQLEII